LRLVAADVTPDSVAVRSLAECGLAVRGPRGAGHAET
jgi:hypothetical protein